MVKYQNQTNHSKQGNFRVPLNTCYDESKTITKPNILLSGSQRELDAQSIGVQE
jgi:hypothetical protein